jgi:hypothetical protein
LLVLGESGLGIVEEEILLESSLDELFDQVSQSFQIDPSALDRFSYYLLLKAKEFAQKNSDIHSESVNLASNN